MNLGILKKIRSKFYKKEELEEKIEIDLSNINLTMEEEKLLKEATKEFFPATGEWSSYEFSKGEECLLCHLRDDYWLAKKLKQEKNLEIPYKKILYFVNKSGYFYHERRNYEQRVVRWQINFMLNPDSENWICDENYGGDSMFMSPNCDIGFRKAVKDTLLAVGIYEDAIEEGLEKNTNLWLNKMIEQAFINEYDNFLWNSNFLGKNYEIEIPSSSYEHKMLWTKLRKTEYYYKHYKSIMYYGNSEWLEYSLDPNEQMELELKVKKLNSIRLAEIEEYKQQRDEVKRKLKEQL